MKCSQCATMIEGDMQCPDCGVCELCCNCSTMSYDSSAEE